VAWVNATPFTDTNPIRKKRQFLRDQSMLFGVDFLPGRKARRNPDRGNTMVNPPPLPPVVDGPVFKSSTQVYVDNLLPHSTVNVYNDTASTNIVGTATTSTSPGAIWVSFTKPISAGQPITARQQYTGSDPTIKVSGLSGPSNIPVPVLPVPAVLPSPIFVSGFCTCMDSILMDGLIPGATLTVDMVVGSPPVTTTLVSAPVTETPQWFTLATVTIPANAVLHASQNIGALKSPVTPGLYPVPVAPALKAPAVTTLPLLNCETAIGVSDLVPGADLKILNAGNEDTVTNPWSSYTLDGLIPLQAGVLTAQQYFTRCDQRELGPTSTFTVVKQPPKFPKVSYTPCANVTELSVSDLLAGEILTVSVSYSTTSGPVVQPLGSQGVSGGTAMVNLPTHWYPSGAVGAVTLQVAVTLCDNPLPSPGYTSVSVVTPPGPFPAPAVQPPLYACATSVFIEGANPGSVIQVFSGSPAVPRSNPVVATTANFSIKLWTPLVAGESIFASQIGCNANRQSPHVIVQTVPKLALPVVVGPVLSGATSVLVKGVVPGAQVVLFVNGAPRVGVDSIAAEVGPPTGSPPLVEVSIAPGLPALAVGQTLSAAQSLCSVVAAPAVGQGGGVTVQAPVPAPGAGAGEPGGGLGSNNNYFMYSPTATGCANLINVSVTIHVTTAMVWASTGGTNQCPGGSGFTNGFSFQLNCYSPKSKLVAWQQYIINLWGTQLNGAINNWPLTGNVPIIFPNGEYTLPLGSSLPSTAIPAGYTLSINLGNDSSGNVNSIQWVVNGTAYPSTPQNIPALLTANGQPATDVAPIVGFTLGLVGPVCGESAVISSGGGTITYSASPLSPLTVTNAEPTQCAESTVFTAETATTSYGVLPANPGNPFTQTFAASSTTPLIRRLGESLRSRK